MNVEPVTRTDEALERLNRLFDRALRALGDAGRTHEACELAADGGSASDGREPRAERPPAPRRGVASP